MNRRLLLVLWLVIAGFDAGVARAEPGVAFSSLDASTQHRIRRMTAPPAPAARYGCYSTPMYYLMYKGYSYEGDMDMRPHERTYITGNRAYGPDHGSWKLDRNRPDWQEAMVRDWAELGLNNTHLNIYPEDSRLILSEEMRLAISDFVSLSERHGLKIGVRLDALGGYKAWEMNPDNPDHLIEPYLEWVRKVAGLLKGRTVYYVLGDELTLHKAEKDLPAEKWTPEKYLAYFKQVSKAIKSADPEAVVSMFAASSGEWFNVLYLLEIGYAEYGDAVAINYYNYQQVPKFFEDARRLAPKLKFLSNGVGYTSNALAVPRYPENDPYYDWPTEEQHAETIAKNMFAWWDLGASTAPYYVSLRNWVIRGRVHPRWFGFFGFEDYVVDDYDNLTVKRYPGWYAFQTVAHTFYNRDEFVAPGFAVTATEPPAMLRAYTHKVDGGEELLLMLWHDEKALDTTINIASRDYRHPVRVALFNHADWSDVAHEISDKGVSFKLKAGPAPAIIRLVRLD